MILKAISVSSIFAFLVQCYLGLHIIYRGYGAENIYKKLFKKVLAPSEEHDKKVLAPYATPAKKSLCPVC